MLAQEILAGQLLVETEDRRRVLIDADTVLTVIRSGSTQGEGPSREGPSRGGNKPRRDQRENEEPGN